MIDPVIVIASVSWPLPFTFRARLRKCQRRNQQADESDNCFLHDASIECFTA